MKIDAFPRILKDPKTIFILNLVIGLLLLLVTLFFVRDMLSPSVSATGKKTAEEKREQQPARMSLQDYAGILRNNPFGFPAGELSPISPSAGPSASQSDISLIGTVSGRSDLSYAIFADKSGQQDVFRVGQQVFGIGKLERVEKGKVFIRGNGKTVEIPLTEIAAIKEISQPGAASAVPFGRRAGDSTYYVDPQKIQQALEKPGQIMTDARFIPNMVDGRQQGFVLSEVKHGGIYQSLGLQNGDVLLRINEHSISNPEAALQAVTSLRGLDRAQLDIIRSGSKMTMNYQIR